MQGATEWPWRANRLHVSGRLSGDKYTHGGSLADTILNNYSHGRSHPDPMEHREGIREGSQEGDVEE